ncbi:heparan-alpha-glucosaminide N-acetyltransferase [Simiduia curdlanivorans]|uniref:Heparan-alpha-glucosaminide N-acetyltransferase n=1 Tax=Simiduia curdlanivorans TaxID=1492769 RepID=A0ABV8V626_9GAMM|nr:heparan-alpha-glucosaminide N-acetyltransferase [Simiduia curdlanivorans]MDN3638683.1 heparan-alpha-glucosaminide N-acetyltransferase [Simiduia curdlanivorans]
MKNRNVTVDLIRTLAIVLMVVFHFIYDLRSFGYVAWDIPDGAGWKQFRYVILTLFFICVGIGLAYVHGKQTQWRGFLRRFMQVSVGAALVTAMSLVMFPKNWIYFGVLHFIALASLLALPLARRPQVALWFGLLFIAAFNMGWISSRWPFIYIGQWLPSYANDFVPIIPWFGVVCLGIFLGHSRWLARDPLGMIKLKRWQAWPGKHSLLVYLIHQPILIGLLTVFNYLMVK